jgi:hypothetical protein
MDHTVVRKAHYLANAVHVPTRKAAVLRMADRLEADPGDYFSFVAVMVRGPITRWDAGSETDIQMEGARAIRVTIR